MLSTHRARIDRVEHCIGRGPLTVVQVSDVHAGGRGVLRAFEHMVAELPTNPDLLVVTGDSVFDRDADDARHVASVLRAHVSPVLGAFAILGNHDYHLYGSPNRQRKPDVGLAEAVTREFESAGFTMLRNRWVEPRPGLVVAGTDDKDARRFDAASTLAGAPDGLRIALVHNPDAALQLLAIHRADVVLCGHTHAGQIRFPLLGAPVPGIEARRYVAGLFRVRGASMYVSRGFGYSHLPLRLFAPPELTVHEIV